MVKLSCTVTVPSRVPIQRLAACPASTEQRELSPDSGGRTAPHGTELPWEPLLEPWEYSRGIGEEMELQRGWRGHAECCGSARLCKKAEVPSQLRVFPPWLPKSEKFVCRVVTVPELAGWLCGC